MNRKITSLDDFLYRLEDVRETGNHDYTALCPAHDDKNPSLSVKGEKDRILVHCFAGCQPEEIVKALGLHMNDLFLDQDILNDKGQPE